MGENLENTLRQEQEYRESLYGFQAAAEQAMNDAAGRGDREAVASQQAVIAQYDRLIAISIKRSEDLMRGQFTLESMEAEYLDHFLNPREEDHPPPRRSGGNLRDFDKEWGRATYRSGHGPSLWARFIGWLGDLFGR